MSITAGIEPSAMALHPRPEIRVLLVDPSPFSRACALAGLVTAIDLAVEACTTLREWTPAQTPDVVLFQNHQGGGGCATLSEQLLEATNRWPNVATLVVADPGDAMQIAASLRSGAKGLLTSNVSLESMIDTIRILMKDLAVYPREVIDLLRGTLVGAAGATDRSEPPSADAPFDDDRFRLFTPRQQEVLRLLAHGLPNRAIAHRLSISESTVKVHIRAIMTRTGVNNRTQIVAHFIARPS